MLASHVEEDDKTETSLKEYTKLVHDSYAKHGTLTKLFPTSSRFIHLYEREVNRHLDQAPSLSTSSTDLASLQRALTEKSPVPSGPIDVTSRPEVKDEPDSTGYANVIPLIENVVETIKESTDQTPKKASRKRKSKIALSGTNERRNCLQCGKPKSKMEGEENLHYTFISQESGMPSMFYCPTKMNNLFGTPLDMQFSEL